MRSTDHLPPSSLLRNRNFVLLWCAYAVSAMGDHLSEMAILKTQNALDESVDVTPLDARMTFIFFVPFFVLGPIAGVLADRLPRRLVMITADLSRCAVMFAFSWLIALTGDWGTWGPFYPLLLLGLFAALFSPARSALLPTLIRPDQLVRANGMISGLGIIATMIALYIGGQLANRYDPQIAFWADAGTYVVSAAFLFAIIVPRRRRVETKEDPRDRAQPPVDPDAAAVNAGEPSSEEGVAASTTDALTELRRGFRYVLTHRRIRELLAVGAVVWFCGPLVKNVIPAVVRDVYGGDFVTMSSYRVFLGLGVIIGAVIISILGNALRSEIAITWGLFGISAGMAVFASSVFLGLDENTLYVIGAVGVIMGGLFAACTMAGYNALLQRTVPNRFRGRVFGVKDLVTTAALLTATGFLGIPKWTRVDEWVGYILLAVAAITFAAAMATLAIRLRRGEHGRALTFAENLNEFVAKFWWRLERVGRSTVPREGATIITANHTCPADPMFLSAVTQRVISFMVAAEYTRWPIARHCMRLLDCIPVKRDGRDTSATKRAIRHLREGKALGIFIEGRIVPPGQEARPKDGVAMLALKTGATVIPAHISGVRYRKNMVRGLLARHRAVVRFGPPVDLSEFAGVKPDRECLRAVSRKIYAAIKALAPDNTEDRATGKRASPTEEAPA